MRRCSRWLLLAPAVWLSGCNLLAWPLYVLAPRGPRDTVKAEFDGLVGKTVAVVVYADMNMLYEYPYCREEMSTAVSKELIDNVKGAWPVPPGKVVRYQDANPHWAAMSMVELGRALNADYVLYISLSEYSTHEPGTIALPEGRVSAAVSVWDTGAPADSASACVWRKADLSQRVEANAGPLARNEAALRVVMQQQFAVKLVKHFYDHKAPRQP